MIEALRESIAGTDSDRHLPLLAEAGEILTSSLEYATTLASVARFSVPALADCCAVHLVEDGRALELVAVTAANPDVEQRVRELMLRYPPDSSRKSVIMNALRTGKSVLVPDLAGATIQVASVAVDAEHRQRLDELAFRAVMVVPLVARGRTLGTISFALLDAPRVYGQADLALAEDLARRCALAIDNARLYESERRQRQISEALLEVAQRITAALTLDDALAAVLQAVHALFDGASASIYMVDEGGEITTRRFTTRHGGQPHWDEREEPLPVFGPLAALLSKGEPYFIAHISADQRYRRNTEPDTDSVAAVPVRREGRIIGVLYANWREARASDSVDLRLLETLAAYGGIAIENTRRYEAEQAARQASARRGGRLRALHEAALSIAGPVASEPRTMITLMSRVVHSAVAALGARSGWLCLAEDPAWQGILPGTSPGDGLITLDRYGHLWRWPARVGGATRYVLDSGEPLSVTDTRLDSPFGPHPELASRGELALHTVPLKAGGTVLGALGVNMVQPGPLSTEDREALDLFAAHATAALERARKARAERQRAEYAERCATTLARVGAASNLTAAMEALLRGAMTILDGTHGRIRLYSADSADGVITVALRADSGEVTITAPDALPEGSFAAAMRSGAPAMMIDDLWALAPEQYPYYAQLGRRRAIRGAVIVPIGAAGRRIGSLHVGHPQPHRYCAADLALAQSLVAEAGAAIERARLEAARREAVATREDALRQLAQQTEQLAQREAEAVALRELDRLKDEFLRTISHELRTPLTLIHGFSELLHYRHNQLPPWRLQRVASHIFAGSTQLSRLVEDILDFSRVERGELVIRPEQFDLAAAFRSLIAGFVRHAGGERLVLNTPPTLPVCADRDRVMQMTSNLITNALKYAPEGPIIIQASLVALHDPHNPHEPPASPAAPDGIFSGRWVRVEVVDVGPGIPADEQARVWEKFYRGTAVAGLSATSGTGIGLAVVRTLAEAQGGRVGLHSGPEAGACFWFELPAPD